MPVVMHKSIGQCGSNSGRLLPPAAPSGASSTKAVAAGGGGAAAAASEYRSGCEDVGYDGRGGDYADGGRQVGRASGRAVTNSLEIGAGSCNSCEIRSWHVSQQM